MASAPHPPLAARPHRAALLALVLAMLLAQALGLVHASLHGAPHRHAQGPAEPAARAADFGAWQLPHDCDEPRAHGPAAHDEAFGHDAGSAECRLYDQVGHDWALAAPWGAPAAAPNTPGMVSRPEAPVLSAQAAGYLARGPPGGLALTS